MASQYDMKLEGLEKAQRKLKKLGTLKPFVPAVQKAALEMQKKMAIYPKTIRPGVWRHYASKKQKAAFFASLGRNAGRRTKYNRTGTLSRRWTSSAGVRGNMIKGIVGNSTHYARYMQDKNHQQKWAMVTRWRTTQGQARLHKQTLERLINSEINKIIKAQN